jgi:hypothetical protein
MRAKCRRCGVIAEMDRDIVRHEIALQRRCVCAADISIEMEIDTPIARFQWQPMIVVRPVPPAARSRLSSRPRPARKRR